MNARLKGKTVVITGASGGLGEQIARKCAENGANLFLLARNEERLSRIAGELQEQHGIRCETMALDVSRFEDIPAVFSRIYEQAGTIDVLVNNAGYGVFAPAQDINAEEASDMFAVNVVGLIACTKEVIPHMCEARSGHIINIASQAGKLATPKSSVYASTKHAVLGYTNSLRMEMKLCGVNVTAVNPGPIRTEFFRTADPGGSYEKNVGRFMLDPVRVAGKVVDAMLTPRREINLPAWMNWGGILHAVMPGVVEKLGGRAFYKK